jgi:hypothetical protein
MEGRRMTMLIAPKPGVSIPKRRKEGAQEGEESETESAPPPSS